MNVHAEPRDAEAERQRRLMAALLAARADAQSVATRETGARALRGLQAYRANADASAARALASAFATVQRLLGEEDFEQLAREFWRADPPQRGDLGEWGVGLPAWIAAHAQLAQWPYLADCAQLDWAMHRCERAEDAALDGASIARLGDTDPTRLRLLLVPGLALVESVWPIGLIHTAHRRDDEATFDAVRQAIAEQRSEAVVVSRRGWRAIATRVDAATAQWTRALLSGAELGSALAEAPAGFDFAAWLATALQNDWVKGIALAAD